MDTRHLPLGEASKIEGANPSAATPVHLVLNLADVCADAALVNAREQLSDLSLTRRTLLTAAALAMLPTSVAYAKPPRLRLPGAPVLTATSTTIAWSAPSDGGSAITGYELERSRESASFALLAVVTGLSHTDVDAQSGDQYRVRAVNINGAGPYSNVGTYSSEVVGGLGIAALGTSPLGGLV